MANDTVEIGRENFDGVIFDLDGVLVDTTHAHCSAWKAVFDRFLANHPTGQTSRPFDEADYLAYVDGRSREDGVRVFLASRNIRLPDHSDDPAIATVQRIASAKDNLVQRALRESAQPLPGARRTLEDLREIGIKIAIASSSRNSRLVLEVTGLASLVDARVDGVVAAELGLPGKPDPALFLKAAEWLAVSPGKAAMFEDAIPGVEAGAQGGFKLVVGVDRAKQAAALRQAGAHAVIRDLTQVKVAKPAR